MFPEVGSMIVPPGLSNPFRSASSITASPILSLTLRPGLDASSFTQTVATIPAVTRLSRTSGVLPTASSTLAEIFDMDSLPNIFNGKFSMPILPDANPSRPTIIIIQQGFPNFLHTIPIFPNPRVRLKDCFRDVAGEGDRYCELLGVQNQIP